ncbi:MAG: hypothetical protein R2836_03190 [Chitinophagales bacterium]
MLKPEHKRYTKYFAPIAIRTTMLVGSPGETEKDIEELKSFEEMKFERLGVFTYSHEEDTHGYKYEDDARRRKK